jgi:hypothetical protein
MKKIFYLSISMLIFSCSFALLNAFVPRSGSEKKAFQPDPACGNDVFYGMTLQDFTQGVARYRRYHAEPVSTSIRGADSHLTASFQDARSCWYSLDTLEKFICLIKEYAGQAGLSNTGLGIRFYYGMYNDHMAVLKSSPLHPAPNYSSHHTLFMVPTYNNGVGDLDFDPRMAAANPVVVIEGPRTQLYDTLFKSSYINLIANHALAKRPLVLDFMTANAALKALPSNLEKNQGKLCPPTCPSEATSTLQSIDGSLPDNIISLK